MALVEQELSQRAVSNVRAEGRPRAPPNSRPGPKSLPLQLEEHRFALASWRARSFHCFPNQQPNAVGCVVAARQGDIPPTRTEPDMVVALAFRLAHVRVGPLGTVLMSRMATPKAPEQLAAETVAVKLDHLPKTMTSTGLLTSSSLILSAAGVATGRPPICHPRQRIQTDKEVAGTTS